jgi:D-threo-aldose 1-dehydrogenase
MSIRERLAGGPLGFGAAPLGNMFRELTDEEADATVDAAWQHGTRFFDTAPQYGAGLSEIRLGSQLAKHDRDEYELSTKVGRLILDELETGPRQFGEKGDLFSAGRANRMVYDYSEKGTLKSIEDSLTRLNGDRFDFVWVHDLSQDFHGDGWLAQFEIARTGAFYALSQLRNEGVIKGWGLGVNRVEPVELTLSLTGVAPDAMLLAGRYTLLDHELALQRLMPAAATQGVDIVIGGPYSSGVLAGGAHFEYQPAPPEITAKVEQIKAIAQRHGVPNQGGRAAFRACPPRRRVGHSGRESTRTHRGRLCGAQHRCPRRFFGVRCVTNTSSHPTRRYPSTDNRVGGIGIGKRLHRGVPSIHPARC